jgi:hypothetical protein
MLARLALLFRRLRLYCARLTFECEMWRAGDLDGVDNLEEGARK